MTAEELMGIAGVVLSMVFEYFPKASTWYQALTDNKQRLFAIGSVAVIALVVFGASCLGWMDAYTCSTEGFFGLVKMFVTGVLTSQATYLVLPRKAE